MNTKQKQIAIIDRCDYFTDHLRFSQINNYYMLFKYDMNKSFYLIKSFKTNICSEKTP